MSEHGDRGDLGGKLGQRYEGLTPADEMQIAARAAKYSEWRMAFEADRLASGKDQQENWAQKMYGERVPSGRMHKLLDGREVEIISREKWEKDSS